MLDQMLAKIGGFKSVHDNNYIYLSESMCLDGRLEKHNAAKKHIYADAMNTNFWFS